jgi:hypothetical protein
LDNVYDCVVVHDLGAFEGDSSVGSEEAVVPVNELLVHTLEFSDELVKRNGGQINIRSKCFNLVYEVLSELGLGEVDSVLLDGINEGLIVSDPSLNIVKGFHGHIFPFIKIDS